MAILRRVILPLRDKLKLKHIYMVWKKYVTVATLYNIYLFTKNQFLYKIQIQLMSG